MKVTLIMKDESEYRREFDGEEQDLIDLLNSSNKIIEVSYLDYITNTVYELIPLDNIERIQIGWNDN